MEIIKEGNKGGKFGYIGLHFNVNLEKKLKDFFKEEDLHENGIEEDPHVTVLYGFLPEVKKEDINMFMEDKCIFRKDINFTRISLFENSEFDVVKLDVDSDKLHKYNKFFTDNFPYETNFPNYHPHLTIAYVKKGKGKYYVTGHTGKDLMNLILNEIKNKDLFYKFQDSEKNETIFRIECN